MGYSNWRELPSGEMLFRAYNLHGAFEVGRSEFHDLIVGMPGEVSWNDSVEAWGLREDGVHILLKPDVLARRAEDGGRVYLFQGVPMYLYEVPMLGLFERAFDRIKSAKPQDVGRKVACPHICMIMLGGPFSVNAIKLDKPTGEFIVKYDWNPGALYVTEEGYEDLKKSVAGRNPEAGVKLLGLLGLDVKGAQ